MAEEALTQLQAQIDAIRREAFADGYAAAMKNVQELATRTVPQQSDNPPTPNGGESAEGETEQAQRLQKPQPNQAEIPFRTSPPIRRAAAKRRTTGRAAADTRRSRGGRAKRGTNARMVQEILQKAAPRAVRQADIRRALEHRGVSLPYPSIGHALGQLKARKAAKQVGKSGTWRYSAAA
jgi:type II secretory pathway pseudopilin PulG